MDQDIRDADRAIADEARRLAALRALDVLDTEPEAIFDNLTALAAQTFETHSRPSPAARRGTPIG